MSVLGTTFAHADDGEPYQPVHLPACEVLTVPGVGRLCAYRDVADWRAVLEVDAEVTALRALVDAQADEIDAANDRARALDAALAVRKAGADDCRRAIEGERAALVQLDRELQAERSRPRWGSKLAWAVAAVAAGVAVGVIVAR